MKPRLRAKRSRPGPRRRAPPTVDIVVESPLWKTERGVRAILLRAIAEAAAQTAAQPGELAVVLTDDRTIRALNRRWRHKDVPTNVLSFPTRAGAHSAAPDAALLGDIVIAYETVRREAQAGGLPFRHHLAHLAVHGFLHLVGHDHETDTQAHTMEALEIAALQRLDVPNPYVRAMMRNPLTDRDG
jgi:probable rRNA maturation factor